MIETLPENSNYSESPTTESESIIDERKDENEESTSENEEIFKPEVGYTFRVDSASDELRATVTNLDYSKLNNIWDLTISGASYKVLFPRTDDLVVVDGYLVNIGTQNITGVVLDNSLNLSTYFRRTFTVLPLMTSSAQNNANSYGAHSFMSVYSQGTYSQLNVTQNYGDARVNKTGRFGSTWSGVNVVIIGLLALQVLISFIGGLLRRG